MTNRDVLEWAKEVACEGLFNNSENYLMTVPRAGCERIHAEYTERVEILEAMIMAEDAESAEGEQTR